MRRFCCIAIAILFLCYPARLVQGWQRDQASEGLFKYPNDGDDLYNFVSRPDIRPPKFNIQVQDLNKVTPGYWFVNPYEDLNSQPTSRLYKPAQIGPHIYDGNGELIWSGAHLFEHAATFDFKTSIYRGSPALTFILKPDRSRRQSPDGGGVILNSALEVQNILLQASGNHAPNMHEFTVTEQGTALMITAEVKEKAIPVDDEESSPFYQEKSFRIADNGFREMHVESGHSNFEWWAMEHIDPFDSTTEIPPTSDPSAHAWDWFHLNSIDKNQDGDYLISSRFMSTIYKISGQDGSIIWRLGGHEPSFSLLDGFNFSFQHDARFRFENASHTIITFLDNASNDFENTSTSSSAVTVSLDLQSMTATRIAAFERPDKGLSRLRGNVQLLPDGNTFVCWSENSFISEFDDQGHLVLQASFASERFVTYRAYKFNFTTEPTEEIALKAFVYDIDEPRNGGFTAIYVSWNGATEVASWRFYSWKAEDDYDLIGETTRTGFETAFVAAGIHCKVYVEAISHIETVLGKSSTHESVLPLSLEDASCSSSNTSSDLHSFEATKPHGLLANILTDGLARVQLVLGCCVLSLLVLLSLAVWRIQQLNLRLRDGLSFEYTPLDKG